MPPIRNRYRMGNTTRISFYDYLGLDYPRVTQRFRPKVTLSGQN